MTRESPQMWIESIPSHLEQYRISLSAYIFELVFNPTIPFQENNIESLRKWQYKLNIHIPNLGLPCRKNHLDTMLENEWLKSFSPFVAMASIHIIYRRNISYYRCGWFRKEHFQIKMHFSLNKCPNIWRKVIICPTYIVSSIFCSIL